MSSKLFYSALLFYLTAASHVDADIFDVFLIAGQSNAGNVGELNSHDPQGYQGLNRDDANRTTQEFSVDFARIFDRTSSSANTGLNEVYHSFRSAELDPEQFAVDRLAVKLNQMGSPNLGIYSYSRNGRPLYNSDSDNGESWYPGDDPANGVFYDDELYGYFKDWTAERISELQNHGHTVRVKGVFWFQGEGDVGIGRVATDEYEANLQRLFDRLRVDFGSDVALITTEIRVTGNADQQARQQAVNLALANVASRNDRVEVVGTQDLDPLSSGNVHFTADAYFELADRWAASYQQTAVPESNQSIMLLVSAITLLWGRTSRRKFF